MPNSLPHPGGYHFAGGQDLDISRNAIPVLKGLLGA